MPSNLGIIASHYTPPPPWTPADLSLNRWYQPSDSTTITLTGGLVSGLADKGPNGYHLSADAGERPGIATINGLNVLDCKSSDPVCVLWRNIASGQQLAQPYTVGIVVKSDIGQSGITERIIDCGNQTFVFMMAGAPSRWTYRANTQIVTTTLVDTNPHYVVMIINGASSSMRLDGVEINTGNVGTTTMAADFIVGSGDLSGTASFDGKIGDIVVANGVLGGSDLMNLENYLAGVVGI